MLYTYVNKDHYTDHTVSEYGIVFMYARNSVLTVMNDCRLRQCTTQRVTKPTLVLQWRQVAVAPSRVGSTWAALLWDKRNCPANCSGECQTMHCSTVSHCVISTQLSFPLSDSSCLLIFYNVISTGTNPTRRCTCVWPRTSTRRCYSQSSTRGHTAGHKDHSNVEQGTRSTFCAA